VTEQRIPVTFPYIRAIRIDGSVAQSDPRAVAVLEVEMDAPDEHFPGQPWLQVQSLAGSSKFVALPPSRHLKIFIIKDDLSRRSQDQLNVLVSSANQRAETLLAFMVAGDYASARRVSSSVMEDAERLLYDKLRDPSSAAIGGYFLLSAAQSLPNHDLQAMHVWPRNLSEWMPWMPDGAVIYAWQLLRQNKPDIIGARAQLLEAASRGIPLYTQGLRLLFDGLSLLVDRNEGSTILDQDAHAALKQVRPYAAAADWDTATTTFFGKRAEEPKPRN
jgi:hypothetical protein